MEREWYTHTWWHRVFATIFGMRVVDSFLAYKYEAQGVIQIPDDFATFIGKLAMSLIKNDIDRTGMGLRTEGNDEVEEVEVNEVYSISNPIFTN